MSVEFTLRRPGVPSPAPLSRNPHRPAVWLSIGIALFALAGCTSLPKFGVGGGDEAIEKILASVAPDKLAQARAFERDGKPAKAAEVYQDLAKAATPPARAQLELAAAGALLKAGDASAAGSVLGAIDRGPLTDAQREQLLMREANAALARGRAGEAIAKLQQVNARSLSSGGRADYFDTLAAAQRQNGNVLAAAAALDERDRLLQDPAARMDNQVSLLFTLATLGPAGFEKAARETRGRLRGWVELAAVMSGFGTAGPAADAAFRKWQSGRIGHPALAGLPRAYFATLAGGYPANTKAMVLLPKGGPFGAPAQAIRDGMQAAYNADAGANRPQLDFRDTQGAIGSRFDGGVEAGATLAIGPLQREDVAALAKRASLPVPTLALNRGGSGSTPNLVQFALAPEDEAVNAADFAWAAGLRTAAVLSPNDPWGERMADAFRGRWRTLGGRFGTQQTYTPDLKDYSASASKLMGGSTADVVFLVAAGADTRVLWTALQGAAGRVPVIATSHVYDGDDNPGRDAALAGLYFVDIPWLLDAERTDALSRKALRDRLPNVNGPLARLYAMGIDAYRLAPRIAGMGQSPGTFFPGSTGGLTVDGQGQVRRQLVLARFTSGGPKVQQAIAPAAQRDQPATAKAGDGKSDAADQAKAKTKAGVKAKDAPNKARAEQPAADKPARD